MKKILLFVPFLLLMLSLPNLATAGGGDGDKKPKEELRLDAISQLLRNQLTEDKALSLQIKSPDEK